jgi:methionyl-tRNA formyltransferase
MRVVFIGTGEIGVPVLRMLLGSREHELAGVVTQPDKPAGRDQRLQSSPIKLALAESAIPILQPARIRAEESIAEIRALRPDVIIVMAYGQILPKGVLEIPPIACLNLHASLLPRHRGAAPIQAAIGAGDRETGITVMHMAEGLDTGDILLQSRIEIAPDETGGSLHDRLAEIAPAALSEALAQLSAGTAPCTPQDNALATYAPKLKREDGKINWTESAETIERKIRSFDPWPGAFTEVRDSLGKVRHLKIFRATVAPLPLPSSDAVADRGITVACGDGVLALETVQLEGKRSMSAVEFARGNAWIVNAGIAPGEAL